MHKVGQVVQATVERILPFGIFVRLKDTSLAYIRRRELSLTGDIAPNQAVHEREEIQAKIIALAYDNRCMELSIRQFLPDPWDAFLAEAHVGDIVNATVKHIAPDRIFVQIYPGVDGFILLQDLAPWKMERPDERFWVGDRVQALIAHLDPAKKRVRLSIRQRIEQLERVEAVMTHIDQMTEPPPKPFEEDLVLSSGVSSDVEELGEIGLTSEILVIEDHDDVREPLVKWLNDHGCVAQGVRVAYEALNACALQRYGLMIVDLDMPEMHGIDFIRQLRALGCAHHVAVMSDPTLIADNLPALQTLNVATVFPKPLDLNEIHQFLLRLSRGEQLVLSWDFERKEKPVDVQSFEALTQIVRSGRSLKDRLEQGLQQLVQDTGAELGVVFHLDPTSWKVSIPAFAGVLPFRKEAQHALVESPVKDVIVEGEIIWENRCLDQPGRFRNLLEFLTFESCVGVPIQSGGQSEYALFLFHRKADTFSHYRVRDALAMATLFSVALENQAMMTQARALSNVLLSGHLASAFGHEVYNKVSGLDLQFSNLHTEFERLAEKHAQVSALPAFREVQHMFEKLSETATELQQTVRAFRQLMRVNEETTDVQVNTIIRRAAKEVGHLARKARVSVRLNLDEALPFVSGNRIGLHQIFLNLVLNAIQQMELSESDKRVLTISTDRANQHKDHFVEIRFSDTGPGIHHKLWEQVFALGYTTRPGGSGLGLYIARSLLDALQGQIVVEESLVPLGTTFLITLPATTKENHDE